MGWKIGSKYFDDFVNSILSNDFESDGKTMTGL